MEKDETPPAVTPPQRRPRPPKSKPKFTVEQLYPKKDTSQTPVPEKPAEPVVANPELGHFDVQAHMTIQISDRYGRVLNNEEKVVMGNMLDPANRGILARGIEAHWDQMRGVVIATFGKLIDERVKADAPAPAPEQESSTNVKLAKTQQPITLEQIKPATLPTAKMPTVGALPPPPPK